MKQALTEIYNRKKRTIKTLQKNNNELVAVVYNGLAKNKNIRDIHKEIRKVYQMQPIHDVKVYKYCLKLAKKGKKKVQNNANLLLLGIGVASASQKSSVYTQCAWDFIHEEHVFTTTKQFTYEVAQDQETKSKNYLLEKALKSDMVFALASSHSDCAKDHKDYQGKIYYNKDWRKHVGSYRAEDEIEKYIKVHHLKTIQWVIGKPVWFVTRPNCRHYFKKLSVDEVLHTSVKELTKKYDMYSEIGKKNAQTIRHSTRKEWYKRENIDSLIDKYIDRLQFHRMMYEKAPTDELMKWIKKDEFLIQKWRNYLKTIQ